MNQITCPNCGAVFRQVSPNQSFGSTVKEAITDQELAKAKYEHSLKVGKPIVEMPEKGTIYIPPPPPPPAKPQLIFPAPGYQKSDITEPISSMEVRLASYERKQKMSSHTVAAPIPPGPSASTQNAVGGFFLFVIIIGIFILIKTVEG